MDAHIGAYVSYDFAGSATAKWYDSDDDNYTDTYGIGDGEFNFYRPDAGIQVGVGVWYKKFNFDITYQRGFICASDEIYNDNDWSEGPYKAYSSNLMLRVGYSF